MIKPEVASSRLLFIAVFSILSSSASHTINVKSVYYHSADSDISKQSLIELILGFFNNYDPVDILIVHATGWVCSESLFPNIGVDSMFKLQCASSGTGNSLMYVAAVYRHFILEPVGSIQEIDDIGGRNFFRAPVVLRYRVKQQTGEAEGPEFSLIILYSSHQRIITEQNLLPELFEHVQHGDVTHGVALLGRIGVHRIPLPYFRLLIEKHGIKFVTFDRNKTVHSSRDGWCNLVLFGSMKSAVRNMEQVFVTTESTEREGGSVRQTINQFQIEINYLAKTKIDDQSNPQTSLRSFPAPLGTSGTDRVLSKFPTADCDKSLFTNYNREEAFGSMGNQNKGDSSAPLHYAAPNERSREFLNPYHVPLPRSSMNTELYSEICAHNVRCDFEMSFTAIPNASITIEQKPNPETNFGFQNFNETETNQNWMKINSENSFHSTYFSFPSTPSLVFNTRRFSRPLSSLDYVDPAKADQWKVLPIVEDKQYITNLDSILYSNVDEPLDASSWNENHYDPILASESWRSGFNHNSRQPDNYQQRFVSSAAKQSSMPSWSNQQLAAGRKTDRWSDDTSPSRTIPQTINSIADELDQADVFVNEHDHIREYWAYQ